MPAQNPDATPLTQVRVGAFKSWLSLWIALAMSAGMGLGLLAPDAFQTLGALSFAQVNPVTAILVWLLILPTMVQIDYSDLPAVWRSRSWRAGSALTLATNWLIKPFTMALLAIVFLKYLFAQWIPVAEADQYIAGLILLGVAPCTGMVFVWSRMTDGDAGFTLAQVSLNDIILLIAFAPIAGLLLGASGISVPWLTLGISTAAYVIVPLIAGFGLRQILLRQGLGALDAFGAWTGPLTKAGLILLVVLLFGFQAEAIVEAPLVIALIAIPLIIQALGIFAIAYSAAFALKLPNRIAAPAALIGTSNFFELAVAIAVAMFGVNSLAVIATVVGVLVEVPVMLAMVAFANRMAPALNARAEGKA
ncbi:MAG: ACR3 family arsenite efflux transporter [Pseudomonadota bacterium]